MKAALLIMIIAALLAAGLLIRETGRYVDEMMGGTEDERK